MAGDQGLVKNQTLIKEAPADAQIWVAAEITAGKKPAKGCSSALEPELRNAVSP